MTRNAYEHSQVWNVASYLLILAGLMGIGWLTSRPRLDAPPLRSVLEREKAVAGTAGPQPPIPVGTGQPLRRVEGRVGSDSDSDSD